MERAQTIRAIGSELLKPMIKGNMEVLQDTFSAQRNSILAELQVRLSVLSNEAYELQQQEQKEAIGFLSISHLKHCIYTGNYEMRLDLYNKDFFMDIKKVYQYWDMNFLFQFFENDMSFFRKHIREHLPMLYQLNEYEEKEFALWYIGHYYKIAELFFRQQLPTIFENEAFKQLKKEDTFMVVYGGYMEEQSILFQSELQGEGCEGK